MSTPPAPPPAAVAVADALEATCNDASGEFVACGLSPDEAAALVIILVVAVEFGETPELTRRAGHTWIKVDRDPSHAPHAPDVSMSLHLMGLSDSAHAQLARTVGRVRAGLAGEAA